MREPDSGKVSTAPDGGRILSTIDAVMMELQSRRSEQALEGMSRYGMSVDKRFGWSIPELRALGKQIMAGLGRRNPARHDLAQELWDTGFHEAQILASLVDLPEMVMAEQMDAWAADLDSWDTCDQLCNNLFGRTPFAWDKAVEWSGQEKEFVKRAGFALMAVLAVHQKDAPDERFMPLLAAIELQASDERNFVKKAVNWALRNIGKKNLALNARAVETAHRIAASGTPAGRWIARDALKELEGQAVKRRLGV